MLVSLGAKMMAEKLMQDFPRHRTACQVIVDFTADRDIRGVIAPLGEEAPWRCELVRKLTTGRLPVSS
jgi:hypothetical protein